MVRAVSVASFLLSLGSLAVSGAVHAQPDLVPVPSFLETALKLETPQDSRRILDLWNGSDLKEFRGRLQDYFEDFGNPTGEFRAAGIIDRSVLADLNRGAESYPSYILKLIEIDRHYAKYPEATFDAFVRLQTAWELKFKTEFGASLVEYRRTQAQFAALGGSAAGGIIGWATTLGSAAFFKSTPGRFAQFIRLVLPELTVAAGAGFGALAAGKISDYWHATDSQTRGDFRVSTKGFPPSPAHVMSFGNEINLPREYQPRSWKTDLDSYVVIATGAVASVRIVAGSVGWACRALRGVSVAAECTNAATGPLKATGYALLLTGVLFGVQWMAEEVGESLAFDELVENYYAGLRSWNVLYELKDKGVSGEALEIEMQSRYAQRALSTLAMVNYSLAKWQKDFAQALTDHGSRVRAQAETFAARVIKREVNEEVARKAAEGFDAYFEYACNNLPDIISDRSRRDWFLLREHWRSTFKATDIRAHGIAEGIYWARRRAMEAASNDEVIEIASRNKDFLKIREALDAEFVQKSLPSFVKRLEVGERAPIGDLKWLIEGRLDPLFRGEPDPALEKFVRRRMDLYSIDARYERLQSFVQIARQLGAKPSEIIEAFGMVVAWEKK